MNTKTNHEYTSNSYHGGIMVNDSPAALLDMLAEVASQTLHSEKKHNKSLLPSQCKSKSDYIKRKNQESSFTISQLLSMPASQLVKQFSIFTSDELKRQYSYTCALIVGCGQKYTSFASEGRARMSIKTHLAEHLEYLKTNKETYKTFTARSVNYKNDKVSSQTKKNRLQQLRKPQEMLNKENKNVITEKSTNYLRNILLNDSGFKELDKNKNHEKIENPKKLCNPEERNIDRSDFKVLGDHSYFERIKDEIPNSRETSSFNDVFENTKDENIVLMVVGTDTVHMKEYSHINQKLSEKINQESETIYLPEISWSDETCNKHVEVTTTKPKGKAKFIGTSKEEREMALAFMDRIKKKGNPIGNNLECRICNPPRSFTAPTTLVSHYRSHAGIKPYECRICRAVFTRRHSLKYHMLIHQNQTRFTCADCGKKFRHPSHFREHRRRHTGEAPFGCDDCGQRFKTRNTYKRHLKTRHGKVLTTTGELLYLSEEDFQKVRTNRKKKNDINKEHLINEGTIAAKTIMQYQNNNDQLQDIVSEEYVINEDITDNDKNWESNDAIQIIKNCFETYEVSPESHLIKTETTETEIPVDNKVFNKNKNNLSEEYMNKMQEKMSKVNSYNKIKVVKDEKDQIICRDSINQPELIYHNVNETSSYYKVEYNNLVNNEDENNIEFQESIEFTDNEFQNSGQLMEHIENYSNDILNKQNENCSEHIILKQENENKNNKVSIFANKSYQEVHKIPLAKNSINTNILHVANKTLSSMRNVLLNQNDEFALKKDKILGNCQTVTDMKKNQNLLHHTKQHLYIHNEPLTSIIVQDKCINIIPHKFETCHDQQKEVNKGKKFTVLNKHMQTVNINQNGNQNTILLLTNDILQNNILRIDQNSTANNEIKK